jgi:hypothetical protein
MLACVVHRRSPKRRRSPQRGRRFGIAVAALLIVAALSVEALADSTGLELVATGPTGGNGPFVPIFAGASSNWDRVFFDTRESLVSSDTDTSYDVYQRAGGVTTLVSVGPAGGNGPNDAFAVWASADGTRVVFKTSESLVSADTDGMPDVYQRAGGQTTLISTGPAGGNGAFVAFSVGASADATRLLFWTAESMVSADTDTAMDLYERAGGQTTLISTGPTGANAPVDAFPSRESADGTRVFFATAGSLVSADTDTDFDIYERTGGNTTLVSTGPAASGATGAGSVATCQTSTDGTHVFFDTSESLVSADTDSQNDVYERTGGQTILVSTGPTGGNAPTSASLGGPSADGTHAFFTTSEALVSADTDTAQDLYQRAGGQTTLLSPHPSAVGDRGAVFYRGASSDGSRAMLQTTASLVSADTDAASDVYQRAAGQTTLISTGPAGGNGPMDASYRGMSADGTRVVFITAEALVSADTDPSPDIYEWVGGQTLLISTGSAGGNAPIDATFSAMSPDGQRVVFHTLESLVSADTDSVSDAYVKRVLAP